MTLYNFCRNIYRRFHKVLPILEELKPYAVRLLYKIDGGLFAIQRNETETIYQIKNKRSLKVIGNELHIEPRKKINILILGRLIEGDSIASHTKAFLATIDFSSFNVDVHDEYSSILYRVNSINDLTQIQKIQIFEIDGSAYEFVFFLGVLNQGNEKIESKICKKLGLINIAYAVFDGTIPPRGWVEIVNKYYDALCVPVKPLINYFEKNGILKPVFELPIALDLADYLKFSRKNKKEKFTFGWIGTFEDRKNCLKIIEAFKRAFGESSNVELRMHTRFIDESTNSGREYKSILKRLPANIRITEGVLPDKTIKKLMCEFDAYVYVSMGEGYSISPREALACGHPVILSSIPAHLSITKLQKSDGVYYVPIKKSVPCVQPSLANQICGVMYDIDLEDLVDAFKEVFQDREKLLTDALIKRRKDSVLQYTNIALKNIYRQLWNPSRLEKSTENKLTYEALQTTDQLLYEKYSIIGKASEKVIRVCPAHDGGFCSNINKLLSHIVYAKQNELIIPDWRYKTIISNLMVRQQTTKPKVESYCYGGYNEGNVFFKLFDKDYYGCPPELAESNLMNFVADDVFAEDDFNARNEPYLTWLNSYNLYADENYFKEFRLKYNSFFRRNFRLNRTLSMKFEEFKKMNFEGKYVIGEQIRCAAHSLELKKEDEINLETFDYYLQEGLREQNIPIESDGWRLFLATDNEVALNYFKNKYGHRVLSQTMERLTPEMEEEYLRIRENAGHDVVGFELQQRAANDPNRNSVDRAIEILFDIYMLAATDLFVFKNSNISTMVSYVNPYLKMVYCR